MLAPDRTRIELERALGPSRVRTDGEAITEFSRDESEASGTAPDAVVIAESPEDIGRTLEVADRLRVPVTPRGGGTGRTGGAVPVDGGIVLCTHLLSRVIDIDRDDLIAVVQPGVITGDLHAVCEAEGLFYPPDPNSLASCTIGGNVAENAGGPSAFKYGVTRDYVLGLSSYLMGGAFLRSGKRTVKGVTGYDVTALLVGSEGTLGVFSEVTLRLVRNPPESATLLALFSDVRAAVGAALRLVRSGVVARCMELLDGPTLDAVRAFGLPMPVAAGALLLVEIDGDDGAMARALPRVQDVLAAHPGLTDLLVARSPSERAEFWAARRALSPATRKAARRKISEDVVVPRSKMVELLDSVEEIAATESVRHLTYGHAGDGNLHVNFLWDDEAERPAIDRAVSALMRATVRLGGTLTGEHGVGTTKSEFLHLEQSSELISVQKSIKGVFDPNGLLNPGKIFPRRGHGAC